MGEESEEKEWKLKQKESRKLKKAVRVDRMGAGAGTDEGGHR